MKYFKARKILELAINQYRLASELERIENQVMAQNNFKSVIKICEHQPYLRKIQGGAYFHLARISKKIGENQAIVPHLKNCLKVYPEHQKAKEMLDFEKRKI